MGGFCKGAEPSGIEDPSRKHHEKGEHKFEFISRHQGAHGVIVNAPENYYGVHSESKEYENYQTFSERQVLKSSVLNFVFIITCIFFYNAIHSEQ